MFSTKSGHNYVETNVSEIMLSDKLHNECANLI